MDTMSSLTEAQRAAVAHVEGPLLVLAGPGSGKTRVVTHRITHLLEQGVWPSQIVALTFTNKAADEMRRRVERMVPGQRVWISTFHRFCSRLLREFASFVGLEPNFSIYDMDASLEVMKRAFDEADIQSRFMTADRAARAISSAKADLISPDEFARRASDAFKAQVATVYPVYQQALLRSNAVDFDDLLVHVATLLRENQPLRAALDGRYRFVLVDEYQDTNAAQYAIVRALSIDYPNLAVTGDPDQSIYGWRGANIRNILDFEHDYPQTRVVALEQNFRSTQRIVQAAAHLIAFNQHRKPKELFTNNAQGARVRLVKFPTGKEEADDIAAQIAAQITDHGRQPADFAIFYRTNALSRSLEHSLRRSGIPYQIVRGLEFYQRREIKDVLAYLHLLNNPRDDEAFRRAINTPPRGIGRQTIARLDLFARDARISLLEAAQSAEFHTIVGLRASSSIRVFADLYERLAKLVAAPVEEILGTVVNETQFDLYLREAKDPSDVDREANVRELLSEAREFDASRSEGPWLEPFLERAALVSDTDQWDAEASKVSLMTLHASKGLEFPVVFIIGVEEGLIPHERSRHDPVSLEEERRLLFVGITRARELLQLSHAGSRMRGGSIGYSVTSSFLTQLPVAEMELLGYGRQRLSAMTAAAVPTRSAITPSESSATMESASRDNDSEDHPAESSQFPMDSRVDHIDDVDQSVDDLVFEETSYSDAEFQDADGGISPDKSQPRRTRAKGARGARSKDASRMPLTTATELLGPKERGADPLVSIEGVERFSHGMLVQHPKYGLGRILALSGAGAKRFATVRFLASPEKDHRFCLAFSPLAPVGEPAG